MERLLSLRLLSAGCSAEALVNDVPVARTSAQGGSVCIPVHEYLVEGDNEVSLVIDPLDAGGGKGRRLVVAPAAMGASLRLLLPRMGQPVSEASARSLAELDWAIAEGELHKPPVVLRKAVPLPIGFPRWRWLDLPPIIDNAATHASVAEFVQKLAMALMKGDADTFIGAARVRFEELALAYQQPAGDLVARWRSRIQLLYATKALRLELPLPEEIVMRLCAGGRLAECVTASGEPVLRTPALPDGSRHAWPIRLAVVDGRCHVMR